MKFILSILCSLCHLISTAQSIGMRLGHSLFPSDQVCIRYEHWTNGDLNLTGSLAYEASSANSLRYRSFAFDLLGEYVVNRQAINENGFGLRFGLGACIQNESEPWIFKDASFGQRLNYGLTGEGAVECYLSDSFRLGLFAQQKWLLRRDSGSLCFAFGIGLSYQLSEF